MKQRYTLFLLAFLVVCTARAQFYCEPTFAFGCAGWQNQSIDAGSIVWVADADCTYPDYTAQSTTVEAGDDLAMTVINGVWCGCAVWVDLDNDSQFAEEENLYYSYVGGDPSCTYDFAITIPATTTTGAHRMRVIAPWGSDGFQSTNTNGYGPCGEYQYGNFVDFTLNVVNTTGLGEITALPLIAGPNPTNGPLTLTTDANTPVEKVVVWSADGRSVQQHVSSVRNGVVQLDLSALPGGLYQMQCISSAGSRMVPVVKQ